MRDQQLRQMVHELVELPVEESRDLWPAIRARVEARQASDQPRYEGASSPPRWRRIIPRRASLALPLAALLLVAFAAYSLSPNLRTALNLDPGTRPFEEYGLGQELNLSRSIGGFTITVKLGYADINRVVIAYTVDEPDGKSSADLSGLRLTDMNGLELPLRRTIHSSSSQDPNPGTVLIYDAAGIRGNPKQVRVRLQAEAVNFVEGVDQDRDAPRGREKGAGSCNDPSGVPRCVSIPGPIAFDITLPVRPGKVLELNQTVEVGGKSVTLERVTISPTEARMYLRGTGPFPDPHTADTLVELSVGDWRWKPQEERSVFHWSTAEGLTALSFPGAFNDKKGSATLVVRSADPTADGPWMFRFDVP